MTHYLSIEALQEPNDALGLDEARRAQCSFNVLAMKRPGPDFLREIVAYLESVGVGLENETIFAGPKVMLPSSDGPILLIRSTGGTGPVGTHNDGPGAYRRPGAQIVVRAATWAAAEAMARAAYDALIAIRNQAVSA